jgi:hypothetical protein
MDCRIKSGNDGPSTSNHEAHMKLKAPQGVGDPCVAGAAIAPRDGVYEVAPEIGALLIECFGFVAVDAAAEKAKAAAAMRRAKPAARKA